MNKKILTIAILCSFGAQAKDVIISGNDTLIQDSGILKNSGFNISDNLINVDGILETNIPNSFYFRVENDYANTIVYDKKSAINPFESIYSFYKFLNNQEGKPISYNNKDGVTKTAFVHKVVGENIFLKSKNGDIFSTKIEDIILSDEILNAKNFNLNVSFNNRQLNEDDKFHYSYFANGFNWFPNYTITMKDNNKMDFTFYGNISNNTQSDLIDVDLTLMTPSDQNLIPRPMERANMKAMALHSPMADSSVESFSGMGNVSSQSVEDLTAYKIDGNVDLKAGIASNVLIKEFQDVDYEKHNLILVPRAYDFKYYINNTNRHLNNVSSSGILKTVLFVDQEDNKELTKDFLPSGEINIMKLDSNNDKEVLLPYSKGTLNTTKNENFSIEIQKNKNVKHFTRLEKMEDIVILSKTKKVEGRHSFEEVEYEVTLSQHFENNSNQSETFVFYMNKLDDNDAIIPNDYKKDFVADKGEYRYSLTLPSNSKKDFKIKLKTTANFTID